MAEKKSKVADTKKAAEAPATQPPAKRAGKILKIIIVLIILVMLGSIGFAAGVYLKIFNIQGFVDKYKLYNYPIVGKYFPPPKTNFETVELEAPSVPVEPVAAVQQPIVPEQPVPIIPPQELQPKPPVDAVELEKQLKAKQLEEAKRLAKTARLYGGMKPDEAVPILNQMDDDSIISIFTKLEEEQTAKILAGMEPKRAARLTQMMLKGRASN